MFLISLLISLGAVLYAIYYFYIELATKTNNDYVGELFERAHNILRVQFVVLFRVIVIVSFLIVLVLLSFKALGWSVILGFLVGVCTLLVTVYVSGIFLMKIHARFLDDNSSRLIKLFYQAFDGGNALGTYVLGSALLAVSAYYLVFKPSAMGLVGMVLGTVVSGLFIKITSSIYATFFYNRKNVFNKFIFGKDKKNENKDSMSPFQLVADSLKYGIGTITESLENSISALIGSMIVASLVFPGFGGAIALPLIVVATGLIASVIGIKLIKIGSTSNILINIFLVIFGTITLASILIFPFILWLMTGNEQYSNIALWASISIGFLSGGLLVYLNYISIIKRFGHRDSIAIVSALIALSVALSALFAGIYGLALFVVGLVSLYVVFIKLSSFALFINTAHRSIKFINTETKREWALEKLNLLSNIFTDSVKTFSYMGTVFSALVFFFIYKREIISKFVQLEFQLDNPLIVGGLFLGGSMLYVLLGRLTKLEEKIYKIFKNNKKSLFQDNQNKENDYIYNTKVLVSSIVRSIIPIVSLIFALPLSVAFIFGPEAFIGVFIGEIIIGTFWGMHIILQNEVDYDIYSSQSSYDKFVVNAETRRDGWANNVVASNIITSSIKITMTLALMLVVLL